MPAWPRPLLMSTVFCAAALLGVRVCADEIRLKDGKKLYGVIVSYEDNMFKVKTDFGYVLVEKDKIASIIPSVPGDAEKGQNRGTREREAGTRKACCRGGKARNHSTFEERRAFQCECACNSNGRAGDCNRVRARARDRQISSSRGWNKGNCSRCGTRRIKTNSSKSGVQRGHESRTAANRGR